MIRLVYHVKPDQKENELNWLHQHGIYPACEAYVAQVEELSWEVRIKIGVIVNEEDALMIKLRHPILFKERWNLK